MLLKCNKIGIQGVLLPLILGVLWMGQSGFAYADFGIQVGAFARVANVDKMEKRLRMAGFPVVRHPLPLRDGRVLTGIIVGPYASRDEAVSIFRKLKGLDWRGYVRSFDIATSDTGTSTSGSQTAPTISLPPTTHSPVSDNVPQPSSSGSEGDILVFHEETAVAPASSDSQILIFHDQQGTTPGVTDRGLPVLQNEKKDLSVIVTDLRAETGGMFKSGRAIDSSNYLHANVTARWNPVSQWEFQLGARADGHYQNGGMDYDSTRADYGDSFIRYRGENVRLTAGTQTVLWGRIDEVPPTDRLSVQDMTRFVLDELSDRRRAVPALRLEVFKDAYSFDAIWIPDFREAELPGINSIWSPVDQTGGRIRGVPESPVLSQFISQGTFGSDITGSGGGIRLSHSGEGLDYALTVQRFRHSTPYYELNPTVRASYLGGNPVATAIASTTASTFTERHPESWLFGGDIGVTTDKATWRFEAAYISDVPATTSDFRMITLEGVDWMGGVEFYPGDGDTRVNLQLGGRHYLDEPQILDRDNVYNFNGEIENVFGHNRWRAKARFSLGLDDKDIYLNPELAYLGFEPHELYVSIHYFDGNSGTFGEFHKNDSLLTLGWRAKY